VVWRRVSLIWYSLHPIGDGKQIVLSAQTDRDVL